ncbi:hypothetical protein PUMCH_003680 [Australozyma saopauloensis]|uniref:Uncharacterized protein n=1 Tax=Australozyma saopauloensis TaxID=291208 RepID=A0AAX4HDD1_9ASCO|nr:hypothetical protein PUMCH_003680 [[Candida] saopauloensis]
MQQTSRGTPNEHEAQFQGIFAGRDASGASAGSDASGASAGSDSAPENTDGVAQQRVNDLEGGRVRVQVNIHGQLILCTLMMIHILWTEYLNKAKEALGVDDYQRFLESIQTFRSVVYDGLTLLVNLNDDTMSTIRLMAGGQFIPATEFRVTLLQKYQELRDRVNRFASTVFPDNPWGRRASRLRNKVIRKLNEDAQLIMYYYGYMMPRFREMAIEGQKLKPGFKHEKTNLFFGILGTLAWLFGSIPSVSALEMANETTAFFANMAVVYLDPLFKNHKSLPWKYWTSAHRVSVCLSSCLSILLSIYLVVLIFKPSLIQDLRHKYSAERKESYEKWKSIRESLNEAWPKDLSKEDFTPVGPSGVRIDGSDLVSVYKEFLARVEINTCWVEVRAEEVLSDFPSTKKNQAPPRPPTQAHTR